MVIEYRSINDMTEAILRNLYKLPHDIDLVVGIPRSGMLPANLIALFLNKPFADIDSFIEGRVYTSGERGSFINDDKSKKVLVVDDSLRTGNALIKAKNKLKDLLADDKYTLFFGVVYATTDSCNMIDFFCENIDSPRVFQWNIFHNIHFTSKACFDIDGVLCPNPPIDDDGEQYIKYLKEAPILYKPSVEIDTLVSCRLEKYRDITEEWLKKNNIKYRKLIMLDLPSKEARLKWGKHGEYKAGIYSESHNILFIESSYYEAVTIAKMSHKPVFCVENFSMINSNVAITKNKIYHILLKFKQFFKCLL